jgi:hypothetical protein
MMKDIPGFEGLYAITPEGQVYSYRSNQYLRPEITRLGYIRYGLYKDGKRKKLLAHRLVAEAYIPNPDNLPEVSHLDETRSNNHMSNLAWSSHKENCNMPEHKSRLSDSLNQYYETVGWGV